MRDMAGGDAVRGVYDPSDSGYAIAQERRQRAVDIAANTNGYARLRELVGDEHFAEFHGCVCGIAYAIADRIEPEAETADRVALRACWDQFEEVMPDDLRTKVRGVLGIREFEAQL